MSVEEVILTVDKRAVKAKGDDLEAVWIDDRGGNSGDRSAGLDT